MTQMSLLTVLSRIDQARPQGCTLTGWRSFQLGVLFLPTSALLSGLSLVFAITVARPKPSHKPLGRPISRALALLSALLVLGVGTAIKPDLAAIGLANWLPLFWLFLAVGPYLSTAASRHRVALWIVIGTMPVIGMGLIQAWLGWSEPLEALGGLLAWPMGDPQRATGIFDTVNNTASWLLISFPFLLQRLRTPEQKPLARAMTMAVIGLASACVMLTASRMAVLMLPVAALLTTQRRRLPLLLIPISIYALLAGLKVNGLIDHWPGISVLVPDLLTAKFARLFDFMSGHSPAEVRTSLYPIGWQLISTSPWLGIGENGFRALLLKGSIVLPTTESLNHTHSLPLEFALSHGLPALALLLAAMGWVSAKAVQHWRLHSDPQGQDRAWLLAAGLVIWVHIWDIPAYDSRFNMAGWLIFAALLAIGSRSLQPPQTEQPQRSPA